MSAEDPHNWKCLDNLKQGNSQHHPTLFSISLPHSILRPYEKQILSNKFYHKRLFQMDTHGEPSKKMKSISMTGSLALILQFHKYINCCE